MCQFYIQTCTRTEDVLVGGYKVVVSHWFDSATKQNKQRLQQTIRAAERITGINLRNIQELYNSRLMKQAEKITADPTHTGHNLFQLLPCGWHYRTRQNNQTQGQFLSAGCHSINLKSMLHLCLTYIL